MRAARSPRRKASTAVNAASQLRRQSPTWEEFQALEALVAELRQRVLALEASPPRDQEDARLRRVLASSTHRVPFKACDVLEHRQYNEDLDKALQGALIQTAAELGCWLRDAAGVRDGISIVKLRRRHWLAVYTSNT